MAIDASLAHSAKQTTLIVGNAPVQQVTDAGFVGERQPGGEFERSIDGFTIFNANTARDVVIRVTIKGTSPSIAELEQLYREQLQAISDGLAPGVLIKFSNPVRNQSVSGQGVFLQPGNIVFGATSGDREYVFGIPSPQLVAG